MTEHISMDSQVAVGRRTDAPWPGRVPAIVGGLFRGGPDVADDGLFDDDVMDNQAVTPASGQIEWAERMARLQALAQRIAVLERSNEELARLAADAAHDLRGSLQRVATNVELLAGRAGSHLDEADQGCLVAIFAALGDMRRLLEACLAHGRATAAEPQRQSVDCTELVRHVLGRIRSEIESTGTSVTIGELPVVEADPVQLGRVFQNLLSNACKSAPPARKARVVVSGQRTLAGWQLRVTDDGVGVTPEDAHRIFQPFERGRKSTADGGTGLGLAICKDIVERHGGSIRVEPVAGGGSAFVFDLPDAGRR